MKRSPACCAHDLGQQQGADGARVHCCWIQVKQDVVVGSDGTLQGDDVVPHSRIEAHRKLLDTISLPGFSIPEKVQYIYHLIHIFARLAERGVYKQGKPAGRDLDFSKQVGKIKGIALFFVNVFREWRMQNKHMRPGFFNYPCSCFYGQTILHAGFPCTGHTGYHSWREGIL